MKTNHIAFIILLAVYSFSSLASLSVLTKGNPRIYSIESTISSFGKGKVQKNLIVKEFDLLFEGADIKQGRILFENHPLYKDVSIREAKIKSEDGTFHCKGFINLHKDKSTPEELTFSMKLEPIKDGFLVETSFKDMKITAKLKKK